LPIQDSAWACGSGSHVPPGEVTNAQLSSASAGTSNLSNAVATLDTPFAKDAQTLADLARISHTLFEDPYRLIRRDM
jgi:hypothetical protein